MSGQRLRIQLPAENLAVAFLATCRAKTSNRNCLENLKMLLNNISQDFLLTKLSIFQSFLRYKV